MKNPTNNSRKILLLGTGVSMLLVTFSLFPSSEQNFLTLNYFRTSYETKVTMILHPQILDYDDDILQIPVPPVLEEWELCFPRDCESRMYYIN